MMPSSSKYLCSIKSLDKEVKYPTGVVMLFLFLQLEPLRTPLPNNLNPPGDLNRAGLDGTGVLEFFWFVSKDGRTGTGTSMDTDNNTGNGDSFMPLLVQ